LYLFAVVSSATATTDLPMPPYLVSTFLNAVVFEKFTVYQRQSSHQGDTFSVFYAFSSANMKKYVTC